MNAHLRSILPVLRKPRWGWQQQQHQKQRPQWEIWSSIANPPFSGTRVGEELLETRVSHCQHQCPSLYLVGLGGTGTHDLCIFRREVAILQQVVHQTLSVADVGDQMLPVDLQQFNVGVATRRDGFHLIMAPLFHSSSSQQLLCSDSSLTTCVSLTDRQSEFRATVQDPAFHC